MASQQRKCNICSQTQEQICFLRNSKFYKSCNECSRRLHQKYLDGEISASKRTKEEQKIYNSLYYLKNRDKIMITTLATNERRHKEIFNCDCGAVVRLSGKSKHLSSKKHEDALKSKLKPLPSTRCVCECGANILFASKTKHLASKKHNMRMAFKTASAEN